MLEGDQGELLYFQLESDLRQKMFSGEYGIGTRIPTEMELCQKYGVSRITVRRAIQDLVEEGVLERLRGHGTYVSVPKHVIGQSAACKRGFSSFADEGTPTSRIVLEKGMVNADASVSSWLGIPLGSKVQRIKRVILEDDFPMAIDEFCATDEMLPGFLSLMHDDVSAYELMENHYHVEFGMEDLSIDASTARDDEARVLKCVTGSPLFVLRKIVQNAVGETLHYSKSVIRGDRVTYHFSVNREGTVANELPVAFTATA